MLNIKVFVTNLSLYNEGYLVGGWLTLPASHEEIETFLVDVVKISEQREEWFLTDWESDLDGLCEALNVGEYSSIFKLSECLEEINQKIHEYDEEVLEAALQMFNLEESLEKVSNGEYSVYYDCDNPMKLAQIYVDEIGMFENLPKLYSSLAMYFDYEAYGRDLNIMETLVFHNGNCYWFWD